ncbi:MAG: energy transducer TonB [bacterium]|nr:MAG: energy transducer TonB [bacterium]
MKNKHLKDQSGPSRAMGVSILIHLVVIVALGAGTRQGDIPETDGLVVFLSMPAMEEKISTVPGMHAENRRPDLPDASLKESLNHWKIEEGPPEERAEARLPHELPDEGPFLPGPAEKEISSDDGMILEPERLAEARPAISSDLAESLSAAEAGASGEVLGADVPSRPDEGVREVFLTDHGSPMADNPSSLLAFAGDSAALGMIARDLFGPDLLPARALFLPEPIYPVLSRKRGEEGRVVVEVTISAEGEVRSAKVYSSSSYPRLDRAALEASRKAAFRSAAEFGTPVESVKKVAYRFELK